MCLLENQPRESYGRVAVSPAARYDTCGVLIMARLQRARYLRSQITLDTTPQPTGRTIGIISNPQGFISRATYCTCPVWFFEALFPLLWYGSARIKGYPVYIPHPVYVLYTASGGAVHVRPTVGHSRCYGAPRRTGEPPDNPLVFGKSGNWLLSPLREVAHRVSSRISRWSRSPKRVVCPR